MKSKIEYLVILSLVIISFLTYSNALNAPFIFDDYYMIEENTFLKNPKYFPLFFKGYVTSYPIPKGMCRPLLMLSFAFNYWSGGLNPVGYRIINVLLHFLNATLLYFLLVLLKKDTPKTLAFIITLLFLVHPINTEAVSYISSRSDLMVTFFILGGFLLYLKKRYTLSCLLYVFSLLTKETGLCFPLLIGGHYLLYQYRSFKFTFKEKKNFFLLLSLITISLLYFLYKKAFFRGITPGGLRSPLSNILIQSWVSFFYLRLFLFPDNLNFLHYYPQLNSILQPQGFFPLMGIIIIVFTLLLLRKRIYLLSLGVFWYLLMLLPKFYATLKVPAMEHHFYLPSIGIYIILMEVFKNFYIKNKRYFLYFALGIIFILSIFTVERNYQLNYPTLVWRKGTEKEPQHIGNWLNLGVSYKEKGYLKKARKIFFKALTIFTKDIDWKAGIYVNLAGTYFMEGKYDEAIKYLSEALKLEPHQARVYQIYTNLATLYERKNDKEKALYYLNKALKLNPYSERAYQALARIYIEENKLTMAERYIKKAIEINPFKFYTYFLWGKIYEKKGDLHKAQQLYQKSIEIKSDWYYSHYALALVYMKLKNPSFLKELEKTISLNPQFKPAISLAKFILKKDKK